MDSTLPATAPTQVTKRCHWVPQVYLKAFAADAAQKKVWRLSKNEGEPELKPIQKVAVRFNLYVPRDPDSARRDDSFERKLADLEQWFDNPVWHALKTDMADLSWDPLRKMVSLLVATMMLRNPRHFELFNQTRQTTVDLIERAGRVPTEMEYRGKIYPIDPDSYPALRDASEDDMKRLWISEMNNAVAYARKFMAMRWAVLCSDEPVFVTSDAPVTFVHPSLKFRGMDNPETSVMFPISPTRMLCMDHLHHEPANRYYPVKDGGVSANLLMWRNSLEYMFSHRHTDLVCAELLADAERQGFA